MQCKKVADAADGEMGGSRKGERTKRLLHRCRPADWLRRYMSYEGKGGKGGKGFSRGGRGTEVARGTRVTRHATDRNDDDDDESRVV